MAASLHTAQYRLAQHYLTKLRQANMAICRGAGNRAYWLDLVEQDWGQIKHWQAWSALAADQDAERTRLCSAFSIATADVLRARQTPSEHLAWVQLALDAARKLGDGEAERALLYQLSLAYLNLEELDQADQIAQELEESAQAAKDELSLGRAWYLLGSSSLLRGIYDSADAHLRKSIDILIAHHATEETARVWRGFGRIALYRGDYQQAYDYHIRYLDIVAISGNARELGAVYIALSGVLMWLYDFQPAEEHASRALEIARSNGFLRMIPAALISLADAEKELGKFGNACTHYEEGVAAARSISPPSTVVSGLYGLGQVYFLQGDPGKAFAHFHEALELSREARLLFRICEVAHDMVILHLAQNEMDLALARLHELVSSARQLNTPHFMTKALAGAILVWQRLERDEQAAIWAGLLTNYPQNLQLTLFDAMVYKQLEKSLDTDRYQQALRKGRALALDVIMSEILDGLGSTISPAEDS